MILQVSVGFYFLLMQNELGRQIFKSLYRTDSLLTIFQLEFKLKRILFLPLSYPLQPTTWN